MMKRNLLYCLYFFLSFAVVSVVKGQTPGETRINRYYQQHPVWIEMMNDPNANYFETIKAFRDYWKDRVLPKEPFETEAGDSFEKEVGLDVEESEKDREREAKKTARKKDQSHTMYAAQVRAFKGWMQSVKPWVREDGSIVSAEERQAILDAQYAEQKRIESQNGK